MPRTRRSRPRSGTDISLAIAIAAACALVVTGFCQPEAGADTSGSPDPVSRASVVGGSDANVAPGGTLTGLAEGTKIHVHSDASGGQVFALKARICKAGLNITTTAQFAPTQFGGCVPVPFVSGTDDEFVEVDTAPPNSSVDLDFRVGSGTQTFAFAGGSSTITCDPTHPCALWLDHAVPTSTQSSGNIWKHYELSYGTPASTSSTTIASSTTSTSSTVPTSSTTSVSTSSSTSTSVSPITSTTSVSSTTSTAPANGLTAPATVAAGGSIEVTSGGWGLNSETTATLHSDPVTLGTLTADATGKVDGSLTIPASTPSGTHTLELSGTGSDGAARTLSAPITVTDPTSATSSSGPGSALIGSALARTGFEVLRLAGIAGVLFGMGAFLVNTARRRRVSPPR